MNKQEKNQIPSNDIQSSISEVNFNTLDTAPKALFNIKDSNNVPNKVFLIEKIFKQNKILFCQLTLNSFVFVNMILTYIVLATDNTSVNHHMHQNRIKLFSIWYRYVSGHNWRWIPWQAFANWCNLRWRNRAWLKSHWQWYELDAPWLECRISSWIL